jgi:AcrR family transcriptional regulator
MPYRRTENVVRRLAARHDAILRAARDIAAEGGMAAVQIAAVAERAGIAAGTVYRYFPSKIELIGAIVSAISEREIDAMRKAAAAAPGPLSALAATIATFAARALHDRHLAWALIAEPVDADIETVRLNYRKAIADELQARIAAVAAGGQLPEQNASLSAPALVGALLEGLIGPLASGPLNDPARTREAVQLFTLFALRAIGVVDARARGLVVQTVLPAPGEAET